MNTTHLDQLLTLRQILHLQRREQDLFLCSFFTDEFGLCLVG